MIKLDEARNGLQSAWRSVVTQIKPMNRIDDIAKAWLDFANLLDEYKTEALKRHDLHED